MGRQRARNYYLNLEENCQQHDEGIKFLSTPRKQHWVGTGEG